MPEQSNSANLQQMPLHELAATLGQLRLADCEPHRALLLARITELRPDTDPATPTVVLLRMLAAGSVRAERAAFHDEAAFAR